MSGNTSPGPPEPDAGLCRDVRAAIRDVPDFPRPGILFRDITPLLASPGLFVRATDAMAAPFARSGITHVVAVESRGFIFGAPLAQRLDAALVPVRKPGKLPARVERHEYALEYGTDALEIHADACHARATVLVVDDVLATGGTAAAAAALVHRLGAEVVGFSFLLELGALGGRAALPAGAIFTLVTY
jgi:adenine phosphoribosyltransferase